MNNSSPSLSANSSGLGGPSQALKTKPFSFAPSKRTIFSRVDRSRLDMGGTEFEERRVAEEGAVRGITVLAFLILSALERSSLHFPSILLRSEALSANPNAFMYSSTALMHDARDASCLLSSSMRASARRAPASACARPVKEDMGSRCSSSGCYGASAAPEVLSSTRKSGL